MAGCQSCTADRNYFVLKGKSSMLRSWSVGVLVGSLVLPSTASAWWDEAQSVSETRGKWVWQVSASQHGYAANDFAPSESINNRRNMGEPCSFDALHPNLRCRPTTSSRSTLLAKAECFPQASIDCRGRHEPAQPAQQCGLSTSRLPHTVRPVDCRQNLLSNDGR